MWQRGQHGKSLEWLWDNSSHIGITPPAREYRDPSGTQDLECAQLLEETSGQALSNPRSLYTLALSWLYRHATTFTATSLSADAPFDKHSICFSAGCPTRN